MSRCVFALVALGFAVASAQAQPKPLWEIDTFPGAKGYHAVEWVGFSPDGKTLVAQVREKSGADPFVDHDRLFAWEVATRKETLNHKLGECRWCGGLMRANAVTKAGTVLVTGRSPQEVRLADGAHVVAKDLWGRPIGGWFNADNSNCLWLMDRGFDGYELEIGRMPPLAGDPKKPPARETWLKTKLPGVWDGIPPVVSANAELTRLVFSWREKRNLTLYTITTGDELKLTEVATVKPTHGGAIESMRFSPDGKTLATADGHASVFLWDVEKAGKDWKPRATIAAGTFTVSALAFSPDGRTLAAGTFDKKLATLYLIDVAGGKLLGSYRLPGQLMSVAYSPDSKTLVTGDNRGLIKAWDAEALRNP